MTTLQSSSPPLTVATAVITKGESVVSSAMEADWLGPSSCECSCVHGLFLWKRRDETHSQRSLARTYSKTP
jgi:hypothetical protein